MADVEQVARALNLTPRRVQQLTSEGLPKKGRGEYELGACMAWYIRYLQDALEKRGPAQGGGEDLDKARARVAAANAERLETENARRRGELAELAEVGKFWADCVANARTRLLAIPAKLSPRLVRIENAAVIDRAIRAEVCTALDELAEYEHAGVEFEDESEPRRADPRNVERLAVAAAADGKPVGRRKSPAIERGKRRAR